MVAKAQPQQPQKKPLELDKWEPALRRLLDQSCQPGWYGTIRLEVQNGVVKRLLVERSIMSPDDVAREE